MRVMLADDFVLFREGVARVLGEGGFEVVGQVGTAEDLLRLLEAELPDVVIIDVRMPPTQTTEGLELAVRVHAEMPAVGVLVLSHYVETQHVLRLLEDGGRGVGYLLKDRVSDLDTFRSSVRSVGSGGFVIDPAVIAMLVERPSARDLMTDLTQRERSVLAMMAEGRSNLAIGERLGLSSKTVEAHVHNIFSKLDLQPTPDDHRRVLAVLSYLRMSARAPSGAGHDPVPPA
jgi:DNA-binding NarL/FixJ family response regulator